MKIVKRLLLFILIVIILASSFLIYKGHNMYKDAINQISLEKKVSNIRNDVNFTSINDVPDYYKNAIIAVEDHRFKEHGAIDIIAIGRALVSNLQAKELNEGGSTITQQVAKNLYFIEESQFVYRKIAEAYVSFDLENNYSKEEILEFYINTIYFGDGYYGIKQATRGYYNKDPKDLTLYEATMLAGIPNAPSVYSPSVNPDLAVSRQGKVIRSMVEYGYLSQEEADNISSQN